MTDKSAGLENAKGVKGRNEEGIPLPSRLGDLGSIVSFRSGVWSGASAENGFWCILSLKTNLVVTNLIFFCHFYPLCAMILA